MDNQSPAASDSNPGTYAAPLLTITRAALLATPGVTVLVRPGRYPESVPISNSGTPAAPILFLSEVPQGAVLDGADLQSVFQVESTGVWSFAAPALTQNPYGVNGEWVYINGSPLLPAPAAPPSPGQFYLDFTNRKVWVAPKESDDISLLTVEYASRQGLFHSASSAVHDIQLSGFLLLHNAGWSRGQGAIDISGTNWRVENNTVRWASYTGIHADKTQTSTVIGNRIEWAGAMTIAASRNANLLVANNTAYYGNWRMLDPGGEAGTKWTETIDSIASGNEVAYNAGPGLWFDVSCGYDTIANNLVHDNVGRAVFYEISWNGNITNNLLFHNYNEGLFISSSSACTASQNIAFDNGVGVYLNGNYTRPDDHTDTAEAGVLASMNSIPGVDPARIAQWDSDYKTYAVAPAYYMLINNDIDSNLIFDNHLGMAEWRQYGAPSAIAAYENNTSDHNLFGPVDSPSLFYYQSGPGTYGTGLGSWQAASGRDLNSAIVNPYTSTSLPSWASSQSSAWLSHYNPISSFKALHPQFVSSPSMQVAIGRAIRANTMTQVSFSDPAIQGMLLTYDTEQVLMLWTADVSVRKSLTLRLASQQFTLENGYLLSSTCNLADPTITVSVEYLPTFIHALDASAVEIP